MLEIKNVSYAYKDGTVALSDINMIFPREHTFAVIGESGSGKTTLLNCIARFLVPQQGEIILNGTNILNLDKKIFYQKIGVVFQQLDLFPHLSVCENLTLAPCRAQGRDMQEVKESAHNMLSRLGIADLIDSYPSQISGGQAQRVAIARSLMLKPEFMLLDEPTSALDTKTTKEFALWLKELSADTSFIIVTHDLDFAADVAEKGVLMGEGLMKQSGHISDLTRILQ